MCARRTQALTFVQKALYQLSPPTPDRTSYQSTCRPLPKLSESFINREAESQRGRGTDEKEQQLGTMKWGVTMSFLSSRHGSPRQVSNEDQFSRNDLGEVCLLSVGMGARGQA